MKYNLDYIINYLMSRGWNLLDGGNMFLSFSPPSAMNLPSDFLLEIPKSSNLSGFENYMNRFVKDFTEIFKEAKEDEIELFFKSENSLIKYRIFDNDNADGTIAINKFVDSLSSFKNVLLNAASFTVGNTVNTNIQDKQAEEYLKSCRMLQSEKGSYITRIEIVKKPLHTTFNEVSTSDVNEKLFDVLSFIKEEVLGGTILPRFSEEYLQDNVKYINYELFYSIKNVYSKSQISNVEFVLAENSLYRNIVTEKMLPKIPYFENYLKTLKTSLDSLIMFYAKGYIKELHSENPTNSSRNEVMLDCREFGLRKQVKFFLRQEEYLEAIEAHKFHRIIKISGKSKDLKSYTLIEELEYFEIL